MFYKHYNARDFRTDLRQSLNSVSNCIEFEEIYLRTSDKHAPMKMKTIRANQAPYMTKSLRKAIMTRSSLKNRLYKNFTLENRIAYKKQRNYCSKLYKKERKKVLRKIKH